MTGCRACCLGAGSCPRHTACPIRLRQWKPSKLVKASKYLSELRTEGYVPPAELEHRTEAVRCYIESPDDDADNILPTLAPNARSNQRTALTIVHVPDSVKALDATSSGPRHNIRRERTSAGGASPASRQPSSHHSIRSEPSPPSFRAISRFDSAPCFRSSKGMTGRSIPLA